jgi:hypothetical protein
MNDYAEMDKSRVEMCFFGRGPTGPTGPTGPVGPPAPPPVRTFVHVFSTQPQTLQTDEAVVFDSNSVVFGNSSFTPGSSDIWLWSPGYYYITVAFHHAEPCQMSLIKNDLTIVNGGIFNSNGESSHLTASLIFYLSADDMVSTSPTGNGCKLQLKNHLSSVPSVSLRIIQTGTATPDVVSSITVIMLA